MRVELPTNPTALARLLKDNAASKKDRDEALTRLWDIVEDEVRRLVRARRWWAGEDLIRDAVHRVLFDQFDAYDPSGPFRAWCRTVALRYLIDQYRRTWRRERSGAADELDRHQSRGAESVDEGLHRDLQTPFSRHDESEVRRWPARIRLALLVWGQLWQKASPELWQQTLADCEVEAPFPPPGFSLPADRDECLQVLSEALAVSRNTVSVGWLRHRRRLGALECWRDYPELQQCFLAVGH